ncbi:MAG: hypothetical protein ACREDY_22325 [Bradyrhizobium sp.]
MTDPVPIDAELLNEEGRRLSNDGDVPGAEAAYRAAIAASPEWSVPAYNLGLLFKYVGRWAESLHFNELATRLSPDDEAGWWNLGIAATALGDWRQARRAWLACGIRCPDGDGPPDFGWGMTPVRLDPEGDGEVVWARRIDPARAKIQSIPLPTSLFGWQDVVLTDGAAVGHRVVDGHEYSLFDVLARLSAGPARKFIIELAEADEDAIDALEKCALAKDGAAENWGTATHILCYECSRGVLHQHSGDDGMPAHPHCGLAARDHDHARDIIESWLAANSNADIVRWYEAPEVPGR